MKTFLPILTGVSIFFTASLQSAQTQNEGSDASPLFSEARAIGAGIDEVLGTIGEIGDCDLYYFTLSTAGTVTIRLESLTVDSNLLLFDAYGRGLWGDDDSYTSGPNIDDYDSEIVVALPAGIYYIGLGANNTYAYDNPADFAAVNNSFFLSNGDGQANPSPTVERLYGVASADMADLGDYRLFFDFQTGPPGVKCDARSGISKKQRKHTGNNKYNGSGAGQVTAMTTTKKKAKIYFSCQNDSSYAGPIAYRPSFPPKKKFKTKVLDLSGGGNITAQVKLMQYRETYGPREVRVACISLRKKSDSARSAKIKFRTRAGAGYYRDAAIGKVKFE